MNNPRLKILIIAHELSPVQGSECAEGWNLVTRIAKYHDVTVLYARSNQFGNNSYVKAVNDYFQVSPEIPGLTFVDIPQPKLTKLMSYINDRYHLVSPIGLPFFYFSGYKFWQKAAYKAAKRLHKINGFDIVHQLTQITFREPGYCWELGIPFVWGPTGGTSNLPKEFHKSLSLRSRIMEKFRIFSNYFQFNYTSRIIKANKKAALIYTYSDIDASLLGKRASGKIKLMLDAGTYSDLSGLKKERNDTRKLKGIWCGQLSERKAPSILLKAIAQDLVIKEMIDFQIIGDGPLKKSMQNMAKELHLENIQWIDKVSHDEIFILMGEADFFVHTSLREATSNVIPEALSMSLPVICHDVDGTSIAINETCGIKIPLISPESSINGFHEAINSFVLNRDLLEELKIGAHKRSQEISWNNMAESISNDYLEIVKNKKIEISKI